MKMDLDSDLVQLQGALIKANNACPFKKLEHRGGHEKDIYDTIQIIREILTKKGYLNDNGICKEHSSVLRKVNLFLIFNSDLKIMNDLVQNDNIGHLIWISPTIPKCLLIHMVWGLNLDDFYCETILHCQNLSLELLEIATANLKYSKPKKSIGRAKHLLITSYMLLCSLKKAPISNDNLKLMMGGIQKCFCELLKFYTESPNKEKIIHWESSKLYIYAGEVLISLFEMLVSCFSVFLDKCTIPINESLEMYTLMIEDDIQESETKEVFHCDMMIMEQLAMLNDLLINVAKNNIMSVNVDMFCSWSEYNMDEEEDKTLQTVVGELAYKLHNIMESDDRLENEMISMLLTMSIKPKELSDLINEADRDNLLLNSKKNTEDQIIWLLALLEKDYLFYDRECLECAQSNLNLLSHDKICNLFKVGIDALYNITKLEFSNEVKSLIFTCFNSLNPNDKKLLILDVFAEKIISDKLEMQNYDQCLTEFLNKLVEVNDSVPSKLLELFLQNPEKFYAKIFDCVSKNCKMSHIILELVHFKDFYSLNASNNTISSLVLDSLNNVNTESLQSQIEIESYVLFVKELHLKQIIDSNDLILKNIMYGIDRYLSAKNLTGLLLQLKCLNVVFIPEMHAKLTIPMLIMCAQIMDSVRWDLSTFTTKAVEVLQETLEIQSSALDYFTNNIHTENERLYLYRSIKFLTPLNIIYYNKILNDEVSLLSSCMNKKEIMMCLSYVMPRGTTDEWKKIYQVLSQDRDISSTVAIFCDVLKLICAKTKELKSESSYYCLDNCCRNISIMIQDVTLDENAAQNLDLLKSLINLLNAIPEAISVGCFNCLLNPISRIIAMCKINDCAEDSQQNVSRLIEKLCNESHKILLKKVLINEK